MPRVNPLTFGSTRIENDYHGNRTFDEIVTDNDLSLTDNHNTTYRTFNSPMEPDFGIFDDLENMNNLHGGQIPQYQRKNILATFNSFLDDGQTNEQDFSDSKDVDEIEFVSDMLEDMTRHDDDSDDEMVEVINPDMKGSQTSFDFVSVQNQFRVSLSP